MPNSLDEEQVIATVHQMVELVTEEPDITILELAAELIDTMEDRPLGRQLVMMATVCAAALKIIAVAKRNTPTEGEKE
jgi:hypothetical protein